MSSNLIMRPTKLFNKQNQTKMKKSKKQLVITLSLLATLLLSSCSAYTYQTCCKGRAGYKVTYVYRQTDKF